MSAFIVSTDHIDYLLTAGLGMFSRGSNLSWLGTPETPQEGNYQRGEVWGPRAIQNAQAIRRELTRETANRVGSMLLAENRASVNHRYDGYEVEEEYTYKPSPVPVCPVQVLAAIVCLDYQSCEHEEWRDSEARAFLDALQKKAIHALPGYDNTMWEVTAPTYARRIQEAKEKVQQEANAQASLSRVSDLSRNDVIKAIKAALERRSGKKWSVTGGSGTAYGWITIDAPPKRRTWHYEATGEEDPITGLDIQREINDPSKEFGHSGPDDRAELTALLGLSKPIHHQGESVPAGSDYRAEYLDRAEGKTPGTVGTPYWD